MQPDLVEQVADLACRPQRGDELVPPLVTECQIFVNEALRPPVDHSLQRDRSRSPLAIATHQHQLGPGEQVGQRIGVGILHTHTPESEFDVGQDRRADLGIKGTHLLVDALAGANVGAGSPQLSGHGVQQQSVDVVAHTKGKDTGVGSRRLLHVVEDEIRFDHPLSR